MNQQPINISISTWS